MRPVVLQAEVSSSELRRLVLVEKTKAVVLFSGKWCPDCRELEPVWTSWTQSTSVPILNVEIARGGPEWEEWDLAEIPTIMVFDGGREVSRIHGTITMADLEKLSKAERS